MGFKVGLASSVATRLRDRWRVWRRVLFRPVLAVVSVVWIAVTIFDTIQAQFIPSEYSGRLKPFVDLLPGWSWQVWTIVGLSILVPIILEGCYQELQRRTGKLQSRFERVEREHADLRRRFDEVLSRAEARLRRARSRLRALADEGSQLGNNIDAVDFIHSARDWFRRSESEVTAVKGYAAYNAFVSNAGVDFQIGKFSFLMMEPGEAVAKESAQWREAIPKLSQHLSDLADALTSEQVRDDYTPPGLAPDSKQ